MVGPMGSSGEERMEKRMPLEEVVDWAGRVRRGRWQVEVLLSTTIWPLAYIIDLVNDDVDDDDVDDDVDSIIDAMFSNSERMGREEVEALLLLLLLLLVVLLDCGFIVVVDQNRTSTMTTYNISGGVGHVKVV
mmetsp:Transcript_31517/g.63089  ORF Transcript_31517/g.63089 Transcript_31517/m.63089 type:complete len:133 (-) Transcript_31517:294-692(-)